jgi:hypothetical protein
MKKANSKKPMFFILLSTIAVLLTFGTVFVAAQGNAEAFDTIRVFMDDPNLELAKIQDTSIDQHEKNPTYITLDGTSIFLLDPAMENVLVATIDNQKPQLNKEVNYDQALTIAQDFVSTRGIGVNNLTLIQDVMEDHGAAGKTFRFLWAELLGSQGAVGLRRVAVTISASSGSVISFMQVIPEDLSIEVEPRITYQQAIEIAKDDSGIHPISEEAALDIWWLNNDREQPQFLRWTVTLKSELPLDYDQGLDQTMLHQTKYIIDAQTGKIVEIMN